MKKAYLLIYLSFILFSCEDNQSVDCFLNAATISSNTPVVVGGTLQLNTSGYDASYSYKWTGPNGFESNLQNPSITDLTLEDAGEYKLVVSKGVCNTIESVQKVEVYTNPVTCSPTNNRLIFDTNSLSDVIFTSIYLSTNSGNYELRAGGSEGDLTITFAGNSQPIAGIYPISNNCPSAFQPSNEVCVSFNYYGHYSIAHDGLVSISYTNGKMVAVFCGVIFSPSSLPFTLNTSAKITQL